MKIPNVSGAGSCAIVLFALSVSVGGVHASVLLEKKPMLHVPVTAPLVAPRPDDLTLVRQRLRASFIPAADARLGGEPAQKLLDSLRTDGSWADQVYTDTNRENWKASAHLPRLLRITREYYQPQSLLSGRAEVKDKILAALDYWLRVDPRNDNWWHNEIGVPLQVGELLLLLESDAPSELRQRGASLMTRSKMEKMTGQNLVWTAQIQIMRGCLSEAPALVEAAYERMWQEVRYAGAGEEGVQIDHSFHQHGALLYAGGYGAGFTNDVSRFVGYAQETRYAIPGTKKAVLEAYVLDGQQWMLRGGQWDFGVTGRELIRPTKSAAGMVRPVTALAQQKGFRQKEMAAFAARLQAKPGAVALTGNRHFWLSDYMAHHRPDYFASTRMHSVRTLNTDGFINGENKKSHHLADGAIYLARDGQEYVGIYTVWDWHRIPGTTIEQNTLLEPRKVSHRGTTRFVGGVSDGMYGAAAMDLAAGALHAQKAWFYFDREIVCLGAGIECATGNPVLTSLNQCLLRGAVVTSANPTEELPKGERNLAGAKWVWHDGIGYVFPTAATVQVRNDKQTGSLLDVGPGSPEPVSKDVFSLWIDHGVAPQKGSYAYIMVPSITAAQAATMAAAPLPLEVTSNTPQLQAVWHNGLQMLAASFREAGQVSAGGMTVGVDQPCLLLLRRSGSSLRISVSNPQNDATAAVNVTIMTDKRGKKREQVVRVELPGGLNAGQSVREIVLAK